LVFINLDIRRSRTSLNINRGFIFVVQTVFDTVTDITKNVQTLGKEVDRLKKYTTMSTEQVINCTDKRFETFENRMDHIESNKKVFLF